MYNIHVKKYSLFALQSPLFLFVQDVQGETIHIYALQWFRMMMENTRELLFVL